MKAAAYSLAFTLAVAAVTVFEVTKTTFCGDDTEPHSVDFVRDVRPIFEQHCYACHSGEQVKSGLRLDIKSEALRGGDDHAPNIVPGKPEKSPLISFVGGDDDAMRMPPEDSGIASLSKSQIATLTTWIEQGASWPDGVDLAKLLDKKDHWSFKAISHPEPPHVLHAAWPRNSLDTFILAGLEQKGLRPSSEASRTTWLRRVSFDLVGLPPSIEEVDRFVLDTRSDAFERVVEELLASPRYGERITQHWLDVVRYADTHGYEVNTERAHAWTYRDYVIRAMNRDIPYHQFIRDQIVGDAHGEDAATGFLVTAAVLLPGQIGQDDVSKRLARQDALNDIIVNTSETFLGLSVGCARCHDHKFDPISQKDYYAMQAFFSGIEYEDRHMQSPEADSLRKQELEFQLRVTEINQTLTRFVPLARPATNAQPHRKPVDARLNTDRFSPVTGKRLRFTIHQTNNLEPCFDEIEVFDVSNVNVASAAFGTTLTSSGDTVVLARHELRFANDGQYGNSHSWMSNTPGTGWIVLEFPQEQTVDRVVWGRDREGMFTDRLATRYLIEVEDSSGTWHTVADSLDRMPHSNDAPKNASTSFELSGLSPEEAQEADRLIAEKKSLEEKIRLAIDGRLTFAGTFHVPDKVYVLHRGDPEQPKEHVSPAVLSALGTLCLSDDIVEQSRRQGISDWITRSDNPLPARVMVNRIWQWHFGCGLVETSNDFGRNGAPPSHPELLDWLATTFINSGWSIKQIHRMIVLSSTYRQSSEIRSDAVALDGDCRLLWRFPSRRLEAETIRDTMLATSGRLNFTMGGRGFDLFQSRGGLSGFPPVETFSDSGLRRMIYAHKIRMERESVFGAFDCPDAGQSMAKRRQSTTPIQALNLMNSPFTLAESKAFSKRIETFVAQHSDTVDPVRSQIEYTYRLAFSRTPTQPEIVDAETFVREHGLTSLCRVIFNSNEFLFLP